MALFDVDKWRDAGAKARSVAGNPAAPDIERIEAIVAMERQICAGLELLKHLEQKQHPLADTARNALATIDEARSK